MDRFRITLPFIILAMLLSLPHPSTAGQWMNPKDVIGDPMIARLQHGRKELTKKEKEDIERYGYTGLELLTYADDNEEPGQEDYTAYERGTTVNARGHIEIWQVLKKLKYYYNPHSAPFWK